MRWARVRKDLSRFLDLAAIASIRLRWRRHGGSAGVTGTAGGAAGVADFFATTDGWEAPILNDRAAPQYPRHQRLTGEEHELVDHWLGEIRAGRLG